MPRKDKPQMKDYATLIEDVRIAAKEIAALPVNHEFTQGDLEQLEDLRMTGGKLIYEATAAIEEFEGKVGGDPL